VDDLRLFRVENGRASELPGRGVDVELELQRLIESNLEGFFGVRLVEAAYRFSGRRRGEMDALGLDENGSPVVFEFKRHRDQNIIGQGLSYLDWLLDHKADFRLAVDSALGSNAAKLIDWSSPRLVCVAGAFTRYDEHLVERIDHSVELVRYRTFGDGELVALELVKKRTVVVSDTSGAPPRADRHRDASPRTVKTVTEQLAECPSSLVELYAEVEAFSQGLGSDVTKKVTKHYVAFRRLRNFLCVQVQARSHALLLYLAIDPKTVQLEEGFSRDVRNIGHYGTGTLELRIRGRDDLRRSEDLIRASYKLS
jgi:predicted transport protein